MLVGVIQSLTGHCQTNLNGPVKGAGLRPSSRQLTPLGQGGRTVLFEDVAGVDVAVVVEVVVDRGMGGSKFLQGLYVPEGVVRVKSITLPEDQIQNLCPLILLDFW